MTALLEEKTPIDITTVTSYLKNRNELSEVGGVEYLTEILNILLYLLIFIIPKFQSIFDQLGADLPGITVFLIKASSFVTDNIFKIIYNTY